MKKARHCFRFALVLGALLALTCLSAFALKEGDFEYTLSGSEAKITDYVGPGGDVVVPDTLGGVPVTVIGQKSFRMNDTLQSVTLPSTIRLIDDEAFYDTPNLRSINLPNGLTEIGYEGFRASGLTSVAMPDSVTTLSIGAFRQCKNLQSIHLSANLTEIPMDCFQDCTALQSVEIPSKVTLLNTNAFRNTTLREITIPPSVTTIGNLAFENCKNLQSVTLSYGLKSINRYAFEYCTALKSVYLPTSLTTLSEAAFDHTGITSLIIPYGVTKCFGVNSDSIQEISVPSTADFSASTTSKNCLVYCAAGSRAEKDCQTFNVSYKIDPSVDSCIQVIYQGKRISFGEYGQNPVLDNNRTLVPLRSIFEAMGATVEWDNATRTVIASRNGVNLSLTIGQNILYKNGQAIALDVPAKIMNDRTMVPVRAIAEAFSADVDWVQAAQLVTIVE